MRIHPDAQVNTNAEAQAARISAKKLRLRSASTPDKRSSGIDLEMADKLEVSADTYLKLEETPEIGAGGELVPSAPEGTTHATLSLKAPDKITLDASLDRVELAYKNGVLNIALDAAEFIKAESPIEQMLVHQMAAAHRASLDLVAEAGNTRDPVEKCRLLNTAARLIDVYQKGVLTINKIRTGGQQTVLVQHVQVTDGGQAVINGTVGTPEGANRK